MAVLTRYDIWDLNQGQIEAFPVTDPPGWDAISLYYAKALRRMGYQDGVAAGDVDVEHTWPFSEDPSSYFFQAAMHWTPRWQGLAPPPFDARWNHCTHGPGEVEAFFLPWHRAYIYWFEVIVRAHVAALNGPADWTLPYWNYSFHGDADPVWPRSALPWVFCQERLPAEDGGPGEPNPLYIADRLKRGLPPTAAGEPMYLGALTPYYNDSFAADDYDDFNSILDNAPHGAVHVDVGTGDRPRGRTGWMHSTVTAAYDPIFWMHHAEIDRFWVAWNQDHDNPQGDDWLDATGDPQLDTRWNFWKDGTLDAPVRTLPREMLRPESLGAGFPHSYQYATLPQLPAPTPGPGLGGPDLVGPEGILAEAPMKPVHGESDAPVPIGDEPTTATVALSAPPQELLAEALPSRVRLHLEGISADAPAGNYAVYLNYPDADRETGGAVPHYVGLFSTFGVEHGHGGHGGHGGHEGHAAARAFDVTDIVSELDARGDWDESKATVTFVPTTPPPEGDVEPANLTVDRIAFRSA
jgi:tyrosinase